MLVNFEADAKSLRPRSKEPKAEAEARGYKALTSLDFASSDPLATCCLLCRMAGMSVSVANLGYRKSPYPTENIAAIRRRKLLRKTLPLVHVMHANGGGLLAAPINVPHLS